MKLVIILLFLWTICVPSRSVPVRRIAREPGTRPGSYFYHVEDGLHYHRTGERDGPMYFRCVRYSRGCSGRAKFNRREGFVHTTPHDEHNIDLDYAPAMQLRQNVLRRCANLEYVTFDDILHEERMGFRRSVRNRVHAGNMRNPMARVRAMNYPILPRTLRELTRILGNEDNRALTMVRDGDDELYAGSTTAADGTHSVLFISRRMRQHLLEMSTWFVDGTFWAAPRRPHTYQIFTIVTVWANTIIPVAWALMERRTEHAYVAVLQLLRATLEAEGRQPVVRRIISDYEVALQNAWETVFPEADVQGCLWHACRAFVKYAVKTLLLLRWMRAVPHVHTIIRLCCALPMLPPHLMRRGLVLITREARTQGDFLYDLLRPFLQYIFRNWIRTWRQRQILSVYRSLFRTNNASESSNNRLNRTVRNAHPNIFSLLRALIRIEGQAYDAVVALRQGERVNRCRKARSVRNDRRIRNLERELRHHHGIRDNAISRFLHAASHHLNNIIDVIIEDDAEEPRV